MTINELVKGKDYCCKHLNEMFDFYSDLGRAIIMVSDTHRHHFDKTESCKLVYAFSFIPHGTRGMGASVDYVDLSKEVERDASHLP